MQNYQEQCWLENSKEVYHNDVTTFVDSKETLQHPYHIVIFSLIFIIILLSVLQSFTSSAYFSKNSRTSFGPRMSATPSRAADVDDGFVRVGSKELQKLKEAASAQLPGSSGQTKSQVLLMLDNVFEADVEGSKPKCVKAVTDGAVVFYRVTSKPKRKRVPMLVAVGDQLQPTVFALWKAPELLPQLLIPASVSASVVADKDLMWSDVFTEMPLPPLEEGALVSVRVVGNPAPLAVGSLISSTEDAARSGFLGAALQIHSCYSGASIPGIPLPNDGFKPGEVVPLPEGAEEVARFPEYPGAVVCGGAGAAAAAASAVSAETSAALARAVASAGVLRTKVEGHLQPLLLRVYAPPASALPIFRSVLRSRRAVAAAAAAEAAAAAASGAGAASASAVEAGAEAAVETDDSPVWTPVTGFSADAFKSPSAALKASVAQLALQTVAASYAAKGSKGGAGAAPAASTSSASSPALAVGDAAAVHAARATLHKHLDVEGRFFTREEVAGVLEAYLASNSLHMTRGRAKLDALLIDFLDSEGRRPERDSRLDYTRFRDGPSAAGASAAGRKASDAGAEGDAESEGDEDAESDSSSAAPSSDASSDADAEVGEWDAAELAAYWMKRLCHASHAADLILIPRAEPAAASASRAASADAADAVSSADAAARAAAAAARYLSGAVRLVRSSDRARHWTSGLPTVRVSRSLAYGDSFEAMTRPRDTLVSGLHTFGIREKAFAALCAATLGVESRVHARGGDGDAVVSLSGEHVAAVCKLLVSQEGYGLPRKTVPAAAAGGRGAAGGAGKDEDDDEEDEEEETEATCRPRGKWEKMERRAARKAERGEYHGHKTKEGKIRVPSY